MNTWFECKVKYEKRNLETGVEKKVSEPYLIDAVSYTEAESRIHKELEQYISGEFVVMSIRKANYTDLFFYDDGEFWYKSKVSFVTIDEKAGKEKKVSNMVLVMASDVKEAFERINKSMEGMTVDFDINSITESPIVDVFPYFSDQDSDSANSEDETENEE